MTLRTAPAHLVPFAALLWVATAKHAPQVEPPPPASSAVACESGKEHDFHVESCAESFCGSAASHRASRCEFCKCKACSICEAQGEREPRRGTSKRLEGEQASTSSHEHRSSKVATGARSGSDSSSSLGTCKREDCVGHCSKERRASQCEQDCKCKACSWCKLLSCTKPVCEKWSAASATQVPTPSALHHTPTLGPSGAIQCTRRLTAPSVSASAAPFATMPRPPPPHPPPPSPTPQQPQPHRQLHKAYRDLLQTYCRKRQRRRLPTRLHRHLSACPLHQRSVSSHRHDRHRRPTRHRLRHRHRRRPCRRHPTHHTPHGRQN